MLVRVGSRRCVLAALLLLLACSIPSCKPSALPPTVRPVQPHPRVQELAASVCDYDVTLEDPRRGLLDVRVRCTGGRVRAFRASEEEVVPLVAAATTDGAAVVPRGDDFPVTVANGNALHYRLSLEAAARASGDIDVAYAADGPAWIAAASTWLLRPFPVGRATKARIRIHLPHGGDFASGMGRDASGAYVMNAASLPYATYGVFGQFERRSFSIDGPLTRSPGEVLAGAPATAHIELVRMPGALDVSDEELLLWLKQTAEAVAAFWRGFPVDRVVVVMIPTPGAAEVLHGKVVSIGGPTVALQLGGTLRKEQLRDDWILVHELFHLGFPAFAQGSKWMDEGLATYYEPLIRARAGWRSERATWTEYAHSMPKGFAALEDQGLDRLSDYTGVYWGGALFALLADVQIRERTAGKLALEDGLRAVLAQGGRGGSIWTIERATAVIDKRLGQPILSELMQRYRPQGAPTGFEQLLPRLGVVRTAHGVLLDEDAELAALRRAMVLVDGTLRP